MTSGNGEKGTERRDGRRRASICICPIPHALGSLKNDHDRNLFLHCAALFSLPCPACSSSSPCSWLARSIWVTPPPAL